MRFSAKTLHQNGDPPIEVSEPKLLDKNLKLAVETYGDKVYVESDPHASVTPY